MSEKNTSLDSSVSQAKKIIQARDRIAQAYLGLWGGVETQERARRRIHWLASQAEGCRVLDVGCSEGILAFLLAREGFEVVGVDINAEALEYAGELLGKELKSVRSRVKLIHGDLLCIKLDESSFDTVILGEVLEHLVHPRIMLEKACSFLKPGGRLLVTTPFGHFPDPDHKQTFTLADLSVLLKPFVSPEHLAVEDGYIRFAGRKENSGKTDWTYFNNTFLLKITERSAVDQQIFLRSQIDRWKTAENKLRQEYKILKKTLEDVKDHADRLKEKLTLVQAERDGLVLKLDAAEKKLELQASLQQTKRYYDQTAKKISELREDQAEATAHLTSLMEQITSLQTERDGLVSKLDSAEQTIIRQLGLLRRAEERYNQTVLTIDELRKVHGEEKERADKLKEQLSSLQLKLENLQGQFETLEGENHKLRTQIDMQRYTRNKATWNYYRTRYSLQKTKESLSFQLGQALVQAVFRPGKSTLILPITIAKLVALGVSQRIRMFNPEILPILFKLSNGREKLVYFTTNKPKLVTQKGDKVTFALSEDESAYLTSKENSNFSKIPLKNIFSLKPGTHYQISGTVECKGNNISLWVIEYDDEKRLGNHKISLSNGSFTLNFKTAPEHRNMCIAIRLSGEGFIKSEMNYWQIKEYNVSANNKSSTERGIISPTNQQFLTPKSTIRVAGIMDEFNYNSFKYECDLLQLTPENWLKEISEFKPNMLFIESAWRGKEEKWNRKIAHLSTELVGIIEYCRENHIPTIFWNKEDPIHFETFINTASKFDYVFTTDIDCISRYKETLGHDNVYVLPFACQPAIHNPIEEYERKDKLCFAGAYYTRYIERQQDLKTMTDALTQIKGLDIYDRNYGQQDPRYMFPDEYRHYILGNLAYNEINIAYKGYRYGINMNSIKYSQSMFARRVFELLASNTVTISNYSRGLRLLFGDLVVSSDDGDELKRRFDRIAGDELYYRKLRLKGLRKVLQEHTYENRLSYIAKKVLNVSSAETLPTILVTVLVTNDMELKQILDNYNRQSYERKKLVIVLSSNFHPENVINLNNVEVYTWGEAKNLNVGQLADQSLIAGMVPEDYYGANYLQDLALSTRYSQAKVIGKKTYYILSEEVIKLMNEGYQYRNVDSLAVRRGIVQADLVKKETLADWVMSIKDREITGEPCLAVDEFNYCQHGAHTECSVVNDLTELKEGISIEHLYKTAEGISGSKSFQQTEHITGKELTRWLKLGKHKAVTLECDGDYLAIKSNLSNEQHQYLYAKKRLRKENFGFLDTAKFNLVASPGLDVRLVFLFLNKKGQRIDHIIALANRNHTVEIPKGTEWIQMGLRVLGNGYCEVKKIVLGHLDFTTGCLLSTSKCLLISNNYPEYNNLYRNAFVHQRVVQYKKHGVGVDVFRFNRSVPSRYYEFENIDVISGYQDELREILDSGNHKVVLVHFLDEHIWQVLKDYIDKVKVIVWLHGAEIHPWHRRKCNIQNEQDKQRAIQASDRRVKFWNKIFSKPHSNMHLVFVSQNFADEVMEDYNIVWPKEQYSIIHNFIDTELFSYREKHPEQRKKILSIRPYASRIYANDLSVRAILELSKEPFFDELSFRIIGDGRLFEETVAPLSDFPNVILEKRFLKQKEISELHKEYGLFLCPSRMDTQGVSRDEAMSSGLVPLTCRVAAIPEFVDETCGILVEPEDHSGLADAIREMYYNPELFQSLSKNAANRVRKQSGYEQTVMREIDLINKNKMIRG